MALSVYVSSLTLNKKVLLYKCNQLEYCSGILMTFRTDENIETMATYKIQSLAILEYPRTTVVFIVNGPFKL